MAKKQFKAESKKLLDIVINSIYTHKEIFLRELISNASDALDKRQFYLLTSKNKDFDKKDLLIRLIVDEKNRTLTIKDTGIGMNKEELENNLGIIAKSGTEEFKQNNKANKDIIGHFGVGFYSSFMVAKKVTVITKKDNEAFMWESEGIDGYSIKETIKDEIGTDIILELKEDNDDENYSDYLEERTIKNLIKKYSNFIRYPIIMKVTKSKPKDNKEDEYEDYEEEETLNTMVSIWQKNKKDLKDEDYENFYYEQKFGYEKPIKVIHYNVEGLINFNSILYIPGEVPFDFYTKEFEKGLELYSNNVLITEKSKELLPDYFGFIKGVVDSPDVSLNLSREVIQHDKQLQFIAKKIKEKIQKELLDMLREDREKYEEFYDKFGKIIKFGVYSDWGMNKDTLQDLLMFYSSKENKLITLDEYVNKMINEQKYIYYVTGSSIEKIKKMPQIEVEKEKEHDILFLIDEVDEFAIKALYKYKDKEFKSIASIENNKEENLNDEEKDILTFIKEELKDKVKDVIFSNNLKTYPACLISEGDISIEMEKVLNNMPMDNNIKADKILELNKEHSLFNKAKDFYLNDKEKLKKLSRVLYNQSKLIEGLEIEDPLEYSNDIYELLN